MYQILLTGSAEKHLDKLEASVFRRLDSAILALADDPRPSGCKKLKDQSGVWRIRVGKYRVLYKIDDAHNQVTVLGVLHRREAY